jgi:hypothetical protein
MEGLDRLIENRIRDAIERGAFRNLPGAGAPLSLDDSERLAGDNWLGLHVLKNAKSLPPWIEAAKEIDRETDNAEAILAEYRSWLAATAATLAQVSPAIWQERQPGIIAIYQRYFRRYRDKMMTLQGMKQHFNYIVPIRSLEKVWPPLDSALARLRADFVAALGTYYPAAPPDPPQDRPLSTRPELGVMRPVLPRGARARGHFLDRLAEVATLRKLKD